MHAKTPINQSMNESNQHVRAAARKEGAKDKKENHATFYCS